MNDIALTGVPRGGTTLACKLLGECQDTIALAEPIDVSRLSEHPGDAAQQVRDFFTATRRELLATGRAPGKLVAGEPTANFFAGASGAGRRRSVARHGQLVFDPPPAPGFTLVVKHNASFAALLPDLAASLQTIALVRHPLPVLASWQTVELPVADGRIPAGERLDPALRARLEGIPDALDRQLLILDWFFARFAAASPRLTIVKYEEVVASGGHALFDAAGVSGAPRALQDHNASPLYRSTDPERLAAALADVEGAWRAFYSAADDARALARMSHGE